MIGSIAEPPITKNALIEQNMLYACDQSGLIETQFAAALANAAWFDC